MFDIHEIQHTCVQSLSLMKRSYNNMKKAKCPGKEEYPFLFSSALFAGP